MLINYQLIRNDDTFISLDQRCQMADDFGSDAVISLHCNAAANQEARGIDVFYYQPGGTGIQLAQAIYGQAAAAGINTHAAPKAGNFQVLRETVAPAVLVEVGYMSNMQDLELLQTRGYIQLLTSAILKGLVEVFADYDVLRITIDPGHGGHDNGAVYGVFEDNVNLMYALHLASLIEDFNMGQDQPTAADQVSPWADFQPGEWGFSQAMQLYQLGAMVGYSDNTYRPNQPLTRREAAIILAALIE